MSIKKIKQNNEPKFLDDLKMVREVMVHCERTRSFFKIRKSELLRIAETNEIRYYITDKIFVAKRKSMVVF